MKNLLLKAQHWHYFLLTFAVPMVIHTFIINQYIPNAFTEIGEMPDMDGLFNYFKYVPLGMMFFMLPMYGWMWAVGNGLQEYIPDGLKLNTTLFNFALVISVVTMLSLGYFTTSFLSDLFKDGFEALVESPTMPDFSGIGAYLGLWLFAMFCTFYCYYFSAKTFKTAELQKKVTFGDFVTEFFLHWIFYIGIWILQPKIHKIMDEDSEFFAFDN